MSIKTAFVLGAGLGTRLRPLTEHCPKPLLPVKGKPLICHAFDRLIDDAGVENLIVNTHHAANVYNEIFPNKNYRNKPIQFVFEPILLDTGGGLKNIENLIPKAEENFFIYNGDILATPNLKHLEEKHLANKNAIATLLLRNDLPNGNVCIQKNCVCDMRHRLGNNGDEIVLFTGIYIVRKTIFSFLRPKNKESIVETFLRIIQKNPDAIQAIVDNFGSWQDLGTIDEYNKANS